MFYLSKGAEATLLEGGCLEGIFRDWDRTLLHIARPMAIQGLAAGHYVDIHIDCANQSPLRFFRHRQKATRCGRLRQG